MKHGCFFVTLLLLGKISFSQRDTESKTLTWLDSTFSSHNISWEKITTEFNAFGKQNFKKTESVPEIIKALNAASPVKKPKHDKTFKTAGLTHFESFAKQAGEIRIELKKYLFIVLKESNQWCYENALTKYYLLVHEADLWTLSSIGMYSLTNRLISIYSYSDNNALSERLSLLLLSEKLFLNPAYKNRQEQAEEECALVKIEYAEKVQPGDFEPDSVAQDETEPCFVGGEEGMIRYIKDNIHYPEEAIFMGIQGTVYTSFVVNQDGSLSDIKILNAPDELLSREAIRIIQKMPLWLSGTQAGKNIRVRYVLPIRFSIG